MFIQLVSTGNRIHNPDSLGSATCVLSFWAKLYQSVEPFKPYSFIDLSSRDAVSHPKRDSPLFYQTTPASKLKQRALPLCSMPSWASESFELNNLFVCLFSPMTQGLPNGRDCALLVLTLDWAESRHRIQVSHVNMQPDCSILHRQFLLVQVHLNEAP